MSRKMPRRMQPVEVADVLDQAADLIETEGWCTGRGKKIIGGRAHYCLVGAIGQFSVKSEPLWAMKNYLKVADPDFDGWVFSWNDAQTDRRKVVRHVRKCAKLVRDHKVSVV